MATASDNGEDHAQNHGQSSDFSPGFDYEDKNVHYPMDANPKGLCFKTFQAKLSCLFHIRYIKLEIYYLGDMYKCNHEHN